MGIDHERAILHRCAADGCKQQIVRTLLMCAHHWHLVPLAEQTAVWRTYRAKQHGGDDTPYVRAVADAVAAVRAREAA